MKPDDEIAFLRARDDSRVKYRQIRNLTALKAVSDGSAVLRNPLLAADMKSLPGLIGVFQLHGQTLRRLQERYPEDERIGQAIMSWEDCSRDLRSP